MGIGAGRSRARGGCGARENVSFGSPRVAWGSSGPTLGWGLGGHTQGSHHQESALPRLIVNTDRIPTCHLGIQTGRFRPPADPPSPGTGPVRSPSETWGSGANTAADAGSQA